MTEPTKLTLYADDEPYQVIDLKDIDDMSEEEYNDKLKDAWLRKTHYETIEELTMMAKYYNYEVEEEEEKPRDETDWRDVLSGIIYLSVLFGLLAYVIIRVANGG